MSFDALYYRYFKQLARHAHKKLQENDLTEEIVQDVFVELWKKRSTLDTEGNVVALLYALLRNKILHEYRARMIQKRHLAVYALMHLDEYTKDHELLHEQELRSKLNKVIDQLSPQCREAFTLSRFGHLSYKEIAQQMNVSVNTVEKHIGKALRKLRIELKEYQLPTVLLIGLLEFSHQVY